MKTQIQPELPFKSRDATPEEIQQWIDEAPSYEETVKNVLTAVALGSMFQISCIAMMVLAFYLIDIGI